MWARFVSLLLAIWLVLSTFFWQHNGQEWMFVGLMCGWILCVMCAAAFVEPGVRFGAAILGGLMAIYSLFAHHAVGFTRWHNFAIGALFVLLSIVPSQPLTRHEVGPTRRIST